jgi:hypothetical protein
MQIRSFTFSERLLKMFHRELDRTFLHRLVLSPADYRE